MTPLPSDAKIVVFFGGLNDVSGLSLDVAMAGANIFSAAKAKAQALKAKFFVVGPVVDGGLSTSDQPNLRNLLKNCGRNSGFSRIDPITEGSVSDSGPTQTTSLSASDESAISDQLRKATKAALR